MFAVDVTFVMKFVSSKNINKITAPKFKRKKNTDNGFKNQKYFSELFPRLSAFIFFILKPPFFNKFVWNKTPRI